MTSTCTKERWRRGNKAQEEEEAEEEKAQQVEKATTKNPKHFPKRAEKKTLEKLARHALACNRKKLMGRPQQRDVSEARPPRPGRAALLVDACPPPSRQTSARREEPRDCRRVNHPRPSLSVYIHPHTCTCRPLRMYPTSINLCMPVSGRVGIR